MFTEYEPGNYISFISPTPFLIVAAMGDHLMVAVEALAAYERALHPKKVVTLKGGHFDAYVADFEDTLGRPRIGSGSTFSQASGWGG